MVKIRNYYDRPETIGETTDKPSKTVPDQSMTISEIISRTQKGLPVSGVRVPMYNETEDGVLPDVSKMDISEIYELKRQIARTEKELRKKLQEQQQEEQQRQTEEYYRKKFGKEQPKPQNDITEVEEVK